MGSSFSVGKILAILAVILILVTMGIFIFSNAEKFIKDSSKKIELADSSEFNNIWMSYEKKQEGSKIKAMADKLASNAKENKDTAALLPDLIYKATEGSDWVTVRSTVKGKEKSNVEGFNKFKNDIDSRHTYFVKFVYSEKTNLISGIIVQYEQKDKVDFVPDET